MPARASERRDEPIAAARPAWRARAVQGGRPRTDPRRRGRSTARARRATPRAACGERVEVGVVARPVGQVALEVAGDAPERVVAEAVDRERERLGSAANARASLALVHVEVDDEHAAQTSPLAQGADRGDDVVEDAVAATHSGNEWCVPPPRFAAAPSARRPPPPPRRADRPARTLDELGRPGQPERALLVPA